ncbi:MAG: hypothetical protein ACRDJM_00920, partial [Actinomycetota bacterium]
TVFFSTAETIHNVSVTIEYPRGLLVESGLCAAPDRDLNGCVSSDWDGSRTVSLGVLNAGTSEVRTFQLFVRSDAAPGAVCAVNARAVWDEADESIRAQTVKLTVE